MSTAVDHGTQDINFSYQDDLNSTEFDKRNKGIAAPGIYKGGLPTKVTDASVSISSLECEIGDGTYQIRMENTSAVAVTVASATPFLILRWTYNAVAAWFVDFLSVAEASITANDLVIAEAVYAGPTLTSFNFLQRSVPGTARELLKVTSTIASSMKAHVAGGYFRDGGANTRLGDQDTATLVAPVTNPRIDLVVINRFNTIEVLPGTEAASPAVVNPGMATVLAELHMYVGMTTIEAIDIRDVRAFATGPVQVQWILLSPDRGDLDVQLAAVSAGDAYWLMPGTYTLGADLTISDDDVIIQGPRAASISMSTFTMHLTGDRVDVRGVTLNSTATNADPLLDVSALGVHIHEIHFMGSLREKAVSVLSGAVDFLMDRCDVDACYGGAAGTSYGLWVNAGAGGTGIQVRDNTFTDAGDTTGDVVQVGVSAITDAPGLLLEDNLIEQGTAGIVTSTRVGVTPASNWIVKGNTMTAGSTNAYTIGVWTSGNVEHVHVLDNIIDGRWGAAFDGTSLAIIIEGNRFNMSSDTTTALNVYGVFLGNNAITKSRVDNNFFESTEGSALGSTVGVYLEGAVVDTSVSGNTFNLSQTVSTSGGIRGVWMAASCTGLSVEGNNIFIDRNLAGSPTDSVQGIGVNGSGHVVGGNILNLDCVNTPGPAGILLTTATNCAVGGNTITVGAAANGSVAIDLVNADFNTFSTNVTSAGWLTVDFRADASSDNNVVVANTFRATTLDITNSGSGNIIAHNVNGTTPPTGNVSVHSLTISGGGSQSASTGALGFTPMFAIALIAGDLGSSFTDFVSMGFAIGTGVLAMSVTHDPSANLYGVDADAIGGATSGVSSTAHSSDIDVTAWGESNITLNSPSAPGGKLVNIKLLVVGL